MDCDDEMRVNGLMRHLNDYFHHELNDVWEDLCHFDHCRHVENEEVLLE